MVNFQKLRIWKTLPTIRQKILSKTSKDARKLRLGLVKWDPPPHTHTHWYAVPTFRSYLLLQQSTLNTEVVVFPKRRWLSTKIHGITNYKTLLFIFTVFRADSSFEISSKFITHIELKVIHKLLWFRDVTPCTLIDKYRLKEWCPPKGCCLSTTQHGVTSQNTRISTLWPLWQLQISKHSILLVC
jgi:hypothetical protein